ncbi:MAG: penicillin-binding transpeptidase domain-containing protein [Evtepia sp.]|nr:penicillin-binding transpeptidase domain-containing protein [Evtepia sp.]
MRLTRLVPAAAFFAALLAVFVGLLWNLQVVSGAAYYEKSQRSIARVETVPAARGRLLDRNGEVLAQDVTQWRADLAEDCPETVLRRLAVLCQEEGVAWSGEGSIQPVTARLLARIKEEALTGVTLVPSVTRESSGDLAPHLLGRVGAMSPQEWETYQDQGYAMDAQVGKDGAEAAFESLLRGTPGTRVVEIDRSGQVTGQSYSVTPQPGKDVTLTLDKDIQTAAQEALASFLDQNPQSSGGAAVVLDVEDGGVLAMVSLPGYDTADFSAAYEALAQDPAHPLMNRAVQGLYAPGSTFKLVTAAAALEEGFLTPETQILDTGRYTYYKSPQPQCWLYRQEGRTHGLETVSQAIADSCNVFFYDAGRRVGIETLDQYARALGLGVKTGIELAGEQAGVVAGPAYTQSIGGTWYEGSVLSAAIGQENNRFTPLQLAHMTATLVGGGERKQVHILKQAEGEAPYTPVTLGKLTLSEENLNAIKEGMLAVTQSGSLSGAFRSLPVTAGAKTGSAQVTGEETSNAVLVCFAPYEDPQIALALVAEQGGSGSALGPVAAAIIQAWAEGQN